jgi:DNA-binding response OmpR family regulator
LVAIFPPGAAIVRRYMPLVEPGTLVLIIDDDVDVRDSVAEVLRMEGYDARPVPSADAAWTELTLGAQPAAIILDLWLPGMTSGAFVRRLRASRHACVPVLVFSGSRAVNHTEVDADAVLQKPIEASALVRVVDKLVRLAPKVTAATERRAARARVGYARPSSRLLDGDSGSNPRPS